MTGCLDAFEPPQPSPQRAAVLDTLADALTGLCPGTRVVVAVDGVDGAGKTVLARELAVRIAGRREVHRAGIDGFHRPRAQRYARGRSPETYYRDSYDHAAIRDRLVGPFRSGQPFVTAQFDVETDTRVARAPVVAGPCALLLVDGVFMHRPELVDLWDASVWVDVPFEVSVPRGNARFGPVGPSEADPAHESNTRYVLGQRIYLDAAGPAGRATWVLDNTDLRKPRLTAPSAP